MTQEAAQQNFWASFGIPAYPNTAVPKNPQLPYLTYQAVSGFLGNISNPAIQIWYWTESEAIPNAKADEIAKRIGQGGVILPCDGGAIWIKRGNPWRVSANAQDENSLKLRQLNATIEFIVNN